MNSTRNKGRASSEGKAKRPQMSAQQATMFDRFSVGNASIAESALDCGCKAYETIFTYNRWKAQGYQVKRGQKAVHLPMVKDVEREAENGETKTRRIFTSSSVFCKHQVEPIQTTVEPTPTPPTPPAPIKAPVTAQQPSANPTPVPQPRIDEIMGNWKEIS
jgi:hypothetical protein